jgi:hypothetical protein
MKTTPAKIFENPETGSVFLRPKFRTPWWHTDELASHLFICLQKQAHRIQLLDY